MHCLVFDIETVPDLDLGRRLLGLRDLDDEAVGKAMEFAQLQKSGSDFLPLHQHRVVAISVVMRSGDDLRVWSLGDPDSGEAELVKRFYDGLERYVPELVSWNGSGFDLPVLHYRALKHGVQARQYWDVGDDNREFRFNNYLGRFHWRHLDLMDVLSAYQPRARAGLDAVATMLGFPGKLGMSGADVRDTWQAGGIDAIRNYCETDVLNTYLVYLSFQHMRGVLDTPARDAEFDRLRQHLGADGAPAHFGEFLAAWNEAGQADG